MKIDIVSGDLLKSTKDTIVAGDFECTTTQKECFDVVNEQTDGLIADIVLKGDFTGKYLQTFVLYPKKPKRIMLVGLGKKERFNLDTIRNAAAAAYNLAKQSGVEEISFPLFFENTLPKNEIVRAMAESFLMADYKYGEYKTEKQETKIKNVKLVANKLTPAMKKEFAVGKILGQMNVEARKLVNTPPSVATPDYVAGQAKNVARKYKLKCRVFDKRQIQKMGMGGVLSVAGGSVNEPRFVVLEYGKKNKKAVVLVGKGVTFDSGGLDIKPAEKMETMKEDKTGAVSVLYAMAACSLLKPDIRVIGLMPLAENMPGERAYKPGDSVKTMSGKTVEILNTDAEGRMILVDALHYATAFRPDYVIDIATLTGACWVALGDYFSGIIGNDQKLIDKLKEAGEKTYERLWQLPLTDEYKDLMVSDFADLKNVVSNSPTGGGAITAAGFLSNFVGDSKWAHIDIAGPSWVNAERGYLSKGSSGIGVRLLATFLMDLAGQKS